MKKFLKIWVVTLLLWSGSLISATITVNTTDGVQGTFPDDGLCSFKEAITAANINFESGPVVGECSAGDPHPAIDVIIFDTAILPAIILHATAFEVLESVEIKGPSQDLLTFAGIGSFIRGFRIINTDANASFKISDMTISDHATLSPFDEYGGGIWASLTVADLTLERVKFHNNSSNIGGGGLAFIDGHTNNITIKDCTFQANKINDNSNNPEVTGGAGILIGLNQTVTIKNSVFYDNIIEVPPSPDGSEYDASGGAILMLPSSPTEVSELTITRSTFSNNSSIGFGGAIANGGSGFIADNNSLLTIKHSTITLNTADSNSNLLLTGGGGGIFNSPNQFVNIFNTLVANNTDLSNTSRPDLSGSYTSFGYNLIGNNRGVSAQFPTGIPNVNNDTVGDYSSPFDPRLEDLADNGGPTLSHQLMNYSPALDQGKCTNGLYDQRYFKNDTTHFRAFSIIGIVDLNGGCDIGAFELYDSDSCSNPTPIRRL